MKHARIFTFGIGLLALAGLATGACSIAAQLQQSLAAAEGVNLGTNLL